MVHMLFTCWHLVDFICIVVSIAILICIKLVLNLGLEKSVLFSYCSWKLIQFFHGLFFWWINCFTFCYWKQLKFQIPGTCPRWRSWCATFWGKIGMCLILFYDHEMLKKFVFTWIVATWKLPLNSYWGMLELNLFGDSYCLERVFNMTMWIQVTPYQCRLKTHLPPPFPCLASHNMRTPFVCHWSCTCHPAVKVVDSWTSTFAIS